TTSRNSLDDGVGDFGKGAAHAIRDAPPAIAGQDEPGIAVASDFDLPRLTWVEFKNHRVHGSLRRKSGMSGMSAPLPVGLQSEAITVSWESCRLSGGPIGCGVSLSRLIRAERSEGIAANASASAWCLALSRSGHDRIGVVCGSVSRWRPVL